MKKQLLALLVILSLVFTFIACSESKNENESSGEASAAQSETDVSVQTEESSLTSEEPSEEYTVLDKNYNDTLTIFGKKDGSHVYSRQQWEYDSELQGEAINDAVNERNRWLYDHYGITVKYIANGPDDYFIDKAVINMILGNTGAYDVVCDGLTTMASLAGGGYLYPLNNISENLDLSHSWWDQSVSEALSIDGKVYYAAGDILITDDEYTYCLLYNKELMDKNLIYEDLGGKTLYDVVNEGNWTYDTLFAIAKKCAAITSGGSAMTLDDTWGYVGDIGCLQIMMAGGGYRMAEKDENDLPYLQVASEKATNLFSKLISYMNDASYCKFTERFGVDNYYGVAENMFADGRIAFYNVKLSSLTTILQNTETNTTIGVLPMPKATAEQDSYYNAAAPLHFSCVGIPISVSEDKLDMVCVSLEALGYLGQQSLTKAYIETTLKIKRADQSDDSDMIDLIINTRCFDLALAYDWGKLTSFFNQFAGSSNTAFVSSWEAISDTANADMEATIEYFTGESSK